jgi:PAS domain S-box-containing protein
VDGKVVEYQSVGRDTTARRRAEIELQASEAKYRLLTENIMLGIVIVQDSPMRMLFANQGIASILGYSIQELTTLPPEGLENLIHPDDRLQFFRNFRTRLDGREVPSNYHVRGFRKDGTIVWLAVSAAIVNYDGQTGVQAIFVDITETKHTEIALKESEEKFRTLIEQVQDGIAVVQEGVVKFINPSIPSLLGYTTEEIINAEFASFIAPEELPRVSEMYRKRMNNEPVPTTYETVILRKDGTRVQMEINAGLTVYEGRDALQVLVRDITERKEAEEALRLSETNLVKAQEVAHIGSWHLDLIENILVWTEENYKIFGVPVGTPMTYETFLEVVHPEDRDYVDEKWRASIAGEPYDIVHRVLISDEVKWVREKAELTFDDQGNPISGIGITQDITERKQSEQQVQEYQLRLKALASELTQAEERERSRIAAELHDHVGQVLAFARIQVASARKRTSDLQLISTLDELSETLRQAIGDTRDLVFDLSSPLLKEIGIAAALSEWMETQIGKKHQLKTELIHDDQPIPMDTDVQALVFRTVRELLTNVVKHAQATHVTVCLEHKDDLLRISVKDDGVGYTDDWSSEQTERSRGFGLFNTQERMMDLGGSMEIITEAGKGCEVILLSPTHRNLRDE